MDRAEAAGVLFVASAGNSGINTDLTIHYPSTLNNSNIMSVGATDSKGNVWRKSNYGKKTVQVSSLLRRKRHKRWQGLHLALPLHDVMFLQSAVIAKLVNFNVSLQFINHLPYRVHVIPKSKFYLLSDRLCRCSHHFGSAPAVVSITPLHLSAQVVSNEHADVCGCMDFHFPDVLVCR